MLVLGFISVPLEMDASILEYIVETIAKTTYLTTINNYLV